jgi:hypothetical protein
MDHQISLGGRPVSGFALSDCQGCASAGGFALSEPAGCPDCSNTAYFLGGVIAGSAAVFISGLLVGGYVAKGRR